MGGSAQEAFTAEALTTDGLLPGLEVLRQRLVEVSPRRPCGRLGPSLRGLRANAHSWANALIRTLAVDLPCK